jgi:hypothetical protein
VIYKEKKLKMNLNCTYCQNESPAYVEQTTNIAYCNKLCQIGAGIEDLPVELIAKLLHELSLTEVSRMCMMHSRIRRVCKSDTFKRNYIQQHPHVDEEFVQLLFNPRLQYSPELDAEVTAWVHAFVTYGDFFNKSTEMHVFGPTRLIKRGVQLHLIEFLFYLIKSGRITFANVYKEADVIFRGVLEQSAYSSEYSVTEIGNSNIVVGNYYTLVDSYTHYTWIVDRLVASDDYQPNFLVNSIVHFILTLPVIPDIADIEGFLFLY